MSAFVTDGNQRSTLAVVRALGAAGVAVTVGETSDHSLAGSSRFCARRVRYPSPAADPSGFQQFLRDELRGGGHRVLLPMTDVTTQLVAAIRPELEAFVKVPIPDASAIARAQDKREMVLAAERVGIACPATHMLRPQESIEEVARHIAYPAVLKPRVSRHWRDGRWVTGGVEYAATPAELIERYRRAAAEIPGPLVQEKIHGEGRGVFLLVWDGELKGAFCHRRLREKPPWGGVSVLRDSIAPDPEMIEKSFALLKAMGWQGVAMVEFKVDDRDGRRKLMEVNGRFWGSLQLAMDAGVNFPLMLYRLALGDDVPPAFDYRVGVKSRWVLGDLDHLWLRLRRPEMLNGGSSRLQAVLDFFFTDDTDCYNEIFRRSDPDPGWFELKAYLRHALGRKERTRAR